MKKFILMTLVLLVISMAWTSHAANNSITVKLNGTVLSFDQPPIIENGRTLLPIRAIFEELGASVIWDTKTQTAVGEKNGKKVVLQLNNNNATIDGKSFRLDVPVKMYKNRTFAPARFVAESFGGAVKWNNVSQTMDINLPVEETILYPIRQNGKWGYMDRSGKKVIEPIYNDAKVFKYGLGAVALDDGWGKRWGLIDKTGKKVLEIEYEKIEISTEYFYKLCLNNKWGFYNVLSHKIIKPTYSIVYNFSEGMARVYGNGYMRGYINRTGNEIIPLSERTSELNDFSEGVVLLEKRGVYDKYGNVVNNLAVDRQNNTIIDFDKLKLIPIGSKFINGLLPVVTYSTKNSYVPIGSKLSFVNKSGVIIKNTDIVYDSHKKINYVNGLFVISDNNRYGFMDTSGNIVITPKYSQVENFSDGLAKVWVIAEDGLSGKWGYIDTNGKGVISPKYDVAGDFSNGFAYFRIGIWGGDFGFIDKSGKEIIQPTYLSIGTFNSDKVAIVSKYRGDSNDEVFGVVDSNGKEIIEVKYDEISDFIDGIAQAKFDNKYVYFDTTGKVIWSE